MEASRTLLLASFIFKENKAGYLKYLNERFKIPTKRIFIFETTIDPTRYIVTFKFKIQRRINIEDYVQLRYRHRKLFNKQN